MKKNQKKYYNEDSIIKEIDDAKAQKEREAAHAEQCDKYANETFEWLNAQSERVKSTETYKEKYQQAMEARDTATRLRKHQSSFEPKLLRLKRTLAAFRTEPMPFSERAVVSQ